MPSSYYAVLVSFAIFFACLNIEILTTVLNHPLKSALWLVGTIVGFILLLLSVRMVRIQQKELVEKKRKLDQERNANV